ncbi:MAG: hypothetical protein VYC17_05850 [Nitrospinota bacterium]|nr:hypothetical protein [Nitrospinota bacterium]
MGGIGDGPVLSLGVFPGQGIGNAGTREGGTFGGLPFFQAAIGALVVFCGSSPGSQAVRVYQLDVLLDVGCRVAPSEATGEFITEGMRTIKATSMPFMPKGVAIVAHQPDPERGKQMVVKSDDRAGMLVLEGYPDLRAAPVFVSKWNFAGVPGG